MKKILSLSMLFNLLIASISFAQWKACHEEPNYPSLGDCRVYCVDAAATRPDLYGETSGQTWSEEGQSAAFDNLQHAIIRANVWVEADPSHRAEIWVKSGIYIPANQEPDSLQSYYPDGASEDFWGNLVTGDPPNYSDACTSGKCYWFSTRSRIALFGGFPKYAVDDFDDVNFSDRKVGPDNAMAPYETFLSGDLGHNDPKKCVGGTDDGETCEDNFDCNGGSCRVEWDDTPYNESWRADNSYHVIVTGAQHSVCDGCCFNTGSVGSWKRFTTLDGFTITQGATSSDAITHNWYPHNQGAGLISFGTGQINILNCIFTNNYSYGGGAVAIKDNPYSISPFTCSDGSWGGEGKGAFVNCVFSYNDAGNGCGGAVYLARVFDEEAVSPVFSSGIRNDSEFTNCSFISNRASSGGAIVLSHSSPLIHLCKFEDNMALAYRDGPRLVYTGAEGFGGAINIYGNPVALCNYVHNSDCESKPDIIECTFKNNTALFGGGALSTVEPVHFSVPNPSESSTLFVKNSSFYGNKVTSKDGAICEGISTKVLCDNDDDCIIPYGTYCAGRDRGYGGAIHTYKASLLILNSIIWGNCDTTDKKCDGGENDGELCDDDSDCPDGTCEQDCSEADFNSQINTGLDIINGSHPSWIAFSDVQGWQYGCAPSGVTTSCEPSTLCDPHADCEGGWCDISTNKCVGGSDPDTDCDRHVDCSGTDLCLIDMCAYNSSMVDLYPKSTINADPLFDANLHIGQASLATDCGNNACYSIWDYDEYPSANFECSGLTYPGVCTDGSITKYSCDEDDDCHPPGVGVCSNNRPIDSPATDCYHTSSSGINDCGTPPVVDMGVYESMCTILYVDYNSTSVTKNGLSWETAFQTLHEALSEAESTPVSKILVAGADQHKYLPDNSSGRDSTFQLIRNLGVEGGYRGCLNIQSNNPCPNGDDRNISLYETVLSGDIGTPDDIDDNVYHVVTGSGTNSTAVLDGFTITSGNSNNMGGGLYNNSGSPTIKNCIFEDNQAVYGGGIANYTSSYPRILYCSFINNVATNGGGIYNANSSLPTIYYSHFIGNEAISGGGGGGICNYNNGTIRATSIRYCTFEDNTAENGSAICNLTNTSTLIQDSQFTNNHADYGTVHNTTNSYCDIRRCSLEDNNSEGSGSAIYGNSASLTIDACKFVGNSAEHHGTIYTTSSPSTKITNCLSFDNTANSSYGEFVYSNNTTLIMFNCSAINDSIRNTGTTTATIKNSILRGTSPLIDVDTSQTTLSYSNIEGGWGGLGGNNISSDPLLTGDFKLQNYSPCIDAGDGTTNTSSWDLGGNTRCWDEYQIPNVGLAGIYCAAIDMGAYEVNYSVSPRIQTLETFYNDKFDNEADTSKHFLAKGTAATSVCDGGQHDEETCYSDDDCGGVTDILKELNALYYMKLNNTTETLRSIAWSAYESYSFVSGKIDNAFRTYLLSSHSFGRIVSNNTSYTDLMGVSRMTVAFWVKGFFVFTEESQSRTVTIGFGDNNINGLNNGFAIHNPDTSIGYVTCSINRRGVGIGSKVLSGTIPNDNNWHFVILDATLEDTWRLRTSIDGEPFEEYSNYAHGGSPDADAYTYIQISRVNGSQPMLLDEVILWSENELFTSEEISNLYNLGDTYSIALDNYGPTFGAPCITPNITNYSEGVTGIRVGFEGTVIFNGEPSEAFGFQWTTGNNETFTDITVTPTISTAVESGKTVATIVFEDDDIEARWLKTTINSSKIKYPDNRYLDGELNGNPIELPSGNGADRGDAVFYIGNIPADVNGDRQIKFDDVLMIRDHVNQFAQLPITNRYDIDKSGKVLLTDCVTARAEVDTYIGITLPLICDTCTGSPIYNPVDFQPPLPETITCSDDDDCGDSGEDGTCGEEDICYCNLNTQCLNTSMCIASYCYMPKIRYISISPNPYNSGKSLAIRIIHVGTGITGWVDTPFQSSSGFWVSRLTDEPVYLDWSEEASVIHIGDCEIVPGAEYIVQSILEELDTEEEENYSWAIILPTAAWGDAAGGQVGGNGKWEPPQGTIDVNDYNAALKAYQGYAEMPKVRADVVPEIPNGIVDMSDVAAIIDAWGNDPYPFDDPEDCD